MLDRENSSNRIPVVAVGGLLVEGNRILLVKRKNPPAQGLWTLPGGRVRFGERLVEAIKREFAEETALEVRALGLAGIFEVLQTKQEEEEPFHYVIADYWVQRVSGTPEAGSDAADLGWFPVDDLPAASMPPDSFAFIRELLRGRSTFSRP